MIGVVQRTLAILNQKGGVGKTTVTLGLASAAAAAGRRVLVVDLDPQASSSWVLGLDPADLELTVADVLTPRGTTAKAAIKRSTWSELVDVLPSTTSLQELESGTSKRLRKALEAVEDRYEAILIDCPPSLGNLTRSALTASRHAVVIVEPSALGLRGIGGVADLIDDVWDATNPDLELAGVILNRVPAVSGEAERRTEELARIVGREAIWSPSVPQRVIFNQAVGERRPIHSYGSRAADPIAVFDALWRKVRGTTLRSRAARRGDQ
jgi:chromosome partitioning protein